MDDALLVKFEENKADFIKELAGMYLNYLKAVTAWEYGKNKEEYEGYLDDEEIENRSLLARLNDPNEKYSAGTFLESPVFQKHLAQMEYDGEKVTSIIKGLLRKYEKDSKPASERYRYWWPMMYPIEKATGTKMAGYCFPFDFKIVEWKNAGLFSKGVATLRYELSPFLKQFVDALFAIAKEDGTTLVLEADAPANDNPISSEVQEIPFDSTFTIESKRIKGKTAHDIFELFVLNPNVITDRMILYVNLKTTIGALKKILAEN